MTKLLPCPFCGCEAVDACDLGGVYCVFCLGCSAGTWLFKTKVEAASAWNKRVNEG